MLVVLLLLSTWLLFQVPKISHCVMVLSVQAIVLSLVAVEIWIATGNGHWLVVAGITLMAKGLVIPGILRSALRKMDNVRRAERYTSRYVSTLLSVGVALAGFQFAQHLQLPMVEHGKAYGSVGFMLIFLGVFLIIDHKKAIMQGMGLIVIENGIFLVALSISDGMPFVVELGIFFDLIVTAVIIGSLSLKMHACRQSLDTEKLRKLKG